MKNILYLKSKIIKQLLIISYFVFALMFLLIILKVVDNVNILTVTLQVGSISLAFLWTLFLFEDLFTSSAAGLLSLFYRYKFRKIIFLFFSTRLIFPVTALLLLLEIVYKETFSFLAIYCLIISQVFLISTLAVLALSLCRSTTIPLSILCLYLSVELATFGGSSFLYHAMYLSFYEDYSFSHIMNIVVPNLLISFVLVYVLHSPRKKLARMLH